MKTLKLLLSIVITGFFVSCSNAQDAPKPVKDAFAKKFSNAKSVKWGKENDSEWEAEFKMDGSEYSANFMQDGTWKETEHEMKMNDMPSNVMEAVKTQYPDYKMSEPEMSETAAGMVYEFELKKGAEKMEIAMDAQGKVMNKKMSDNEDKDGEDKDGEDEDND